MQGSDRTLAKSVIYEGAHPVPDGGWTKTGPVPLTSGKGPIFCGSIENRKGAKEQLLHRLFSHVTMHGNILSNRGLPALKKDCLGRPFLSWPDASAPAISFSHANGRMWACLGWAAGIGIDVAYPEEFDDPYPFARIFRREELDQVRGLCGGGVRDGAALLWAVKEADVKALGCGFNLFDPLEVEVRVLSRLAHGFLFKVNLSTPRPAGLSLFKVHPEPRVLASSLRPGLRAVERVNVGRALSAWAAREGQAWMAVALIAPS